MTPRQERFAAEYVVDMNAAAAARRAGYAPKAARQTGAKLLGIAAVRDRVAELAAQRDAAVTLEAHRVLREYARLAFSDIRDVLDGDGIKPPELWPDHAAAAVQSYKLRTRDLGEGKCEQVAEVKLWSKTAALRAAAEHMELLQAEQVVRVVIGGDELHGPADDD